MTLSEHLQQLLDSGFHRIGELEIRTIVPDRRFAICHWADEALAGQPSFGGLAVHEGPGKARELSTYGTDGGYRFSKARQNLPRGWVLVLETVEDLRAALDQFYPAAIGLHVARQQGTLEIENLRDKLNRQTGMYRFARNISDAGAQRLVRETCGPAHQCARKILWQIDAETPLEDSEASRFDGIVGDVSAPAAIPLLCREACNHFVAECRLAAKEEASRQVR